MTRTPDIDALEVRIAIAEYDGGLSRSEAEDLAARGKGFNASLQVDQFVALYFVGVQLLMSCSYHAGFMP